MNPIALAARIDTRWLLLVLLGAVDAWSAGMAVRSSAPRREKLLWALVIFLCPVVGVMIWFVLGPKPLLVPGRGAGDGSWPRREETRTED